MFSILKKYIKFKMMYHFYQKEWKLKKSKNLYLHDKTEYVIHIRNLKQVLVSKKIQRVIKLNQNAWLKPYVGMNTDLREKANNNFEKDFFKFMNNEIFWKTMENLRKHRDIKLVAIERR